MQYGNSSVSLAPGRVYVGLNRTMQYGNKNIITDDEKEEIEFKSYYVVWKPQPNAKNPLVYLLV